MKKQFSFAAVVCWYRLRDRESDRERKSTSCLSSPKCDKGKVVYNMPDARLFNWQEMKCVKLPELVWLEAKHVQYSSCKVLREMTRCDATTTKTTACAPGGQAKSLWLAFHSVLDKREVRDNYCGIQSVSLTTLQLTPRHGRAFPCTDFSITHFLLLFPPIHIWNYYIFMTPLSVTT